MENRSIYQDIAMRTGGDIYLGLVGPVRTGKSTFIKKFMETLVIPNIDSDYRRERAVDELPQSAAGKTIMTTEPKFIPEEAVEVFLDDQASFRVRLIDCVGYVVPSALGYVENDGPRMVVTPWFEEEVPFNMAAEIGTRKVIQEHSTIGLVVTTDGSISDIPREEYEQAEEKVIAELKEIEKPFVVLLNATEPGSAKVQDLARQLSGKYGVPVMPVNCLELTQNDIRAIMSAVLYQFPVKEICVDFPRWILSLEKDHWLRQELVSSILDHAQEIVRIREKAAAMEQNAQAGQERLKALTAEASAAQGELFAAKGELASAQEEADKTVSSARSEADGILADAQAQAAGIVEESQQHSAEMVSEHEVMQQAYQQANQVVDEASAQAQKLVDDAVNDSDNIREGAIRYTDEMLGSLQTIIQKAMEQIGERYDSMMSSLQSTYEVVTGNRNELQLPAGEAAAASEGKKDELNTDMLG